MSVRDVINANAVALDLEVTDKKAVIGTLAQMLYDDGSITDRDAFIDDVYQRESEGKTGIGGGLAIPHGKSEAVKKTCLAIARLKTPIEWESLDQQPVRLVLLFAVAGQDKNNHFVKLLSTVARMLARESFCADLLAAPSKDHLLALFDSI